MLKRKAARRAEVALQPPIVRTAVARIAVFCMLDIFILACAKCNVIRRILAHGAPEAEFPARVLAHKGFLVVAVGIVVVIFICAVVDPEGSNRFLSVEPRAAVHERKSMCILIIAARLIAEADGIAHAAEIRIAHAHHADHAVRA